MKAGIWIRVSSGGQDEANQLPDVERYCQQHGYEVRKRYELHDRSAFKGEQQAKLDEMLHDVRTGRITVLVCWHSDRLERRGGLALLTLLGAVKDAGGRVESTKEPTLGHVDMGGQVATFIGAVIANEKSVHLADQVRIAHDRSRANGALVGRPPFGYTTAGAKYKRRMVATADGRRLVPEVFERVIRGESLAMVARWLAGETGDACWPRTLGTLIRNPAYMGCRCELDMKTRVYGRTLHRCEPLVDAATWKRAGEALDNRPKRGPVKAENRAMLSGVLFCPKCQDTPGKLANPSPMYRLNTGYYRCSGRGSERKGCGNMVRTDLADSWVDKKIRTEWDKPIMERRVIPGTDHSAEVEAVKFEMKQLAQLDLADDDYDRRLSELRAERDRLMGLPVTEDEVKMVTTGLNYATVWAGLDSSQRAAFLKNNGIIVMMAKDEMAVTWRG